MFQITCEICGCTFVAIEADVEPFCRDCYLTISEAELLAAEAAFDSNYQDAWGTPAPEGCSNKTGWSLGQPCLLCEVSKAGNCPHQNAIWAAKEAAGEEVIRWDDDTPF